MKLKTIKKLGIFLILLLALCPSISVYAAQAPSNNNFNLQRALYIEIHGDDNWNLEMTASNKGVFQYKIFGAKNVDITRSIPASGISVDAFVKTNTEWGSGGRRAEVTVDPLTGTATVTCDFTASDKSIFITMNYNNNPSMVNFNMGDIATGSKQLNINNSYDYNKHANIEFLSDYLTDIGDDAATFKYKATYAGRDITKTFPASMINAVTSIDSSIEVDPSTGTGTIKFHSPVSDQVIKTTLAHKLNGYTAILNTLGLSKVPVKRQEAAEVSKINFVTGSLVLTDKDTATFQYRVLDHDNSNITKTISIDDIKATALVGTEKAEVSLDSATGTGTIKYHFTDKDKKAMVALAHKSGVEISAALNVVGSEALDVKAVNEDDLQIAQIAFIPTGIKNDDRYGMLSYRIYNQYGKNITKEIPASSLALSSNVNSQISLFTYGFGEIIMYYNTSDRNRAIIVSIMDKTTGIKAAMNIGAPPSSEPENPTGDKVVQFNNAVLEQEIRKLIYKTTADITENDIKDIKSLFIGKNYTEVSGIENFPNLEFLEIWNSNITDLSGIESLNKLVLLKIRDCKITGLSRIENLKNIARIEIIDCKINSLAPLKQLPNLKQLKCAISTNADVKILTELSNLTFLDLHGSKISVEDANLIKKALPNCLVLY